jgi:hypothetical protein
MQISALLTGLAMHGAALAVLPPPTPEQARAAAAKKAQADAKAAKDKEQLAASMDEISTQWRQRAASEGWRTNAPVAVKTAPPAVANAPTASGQPAAPGAATTPGGPLGNTVPPQAMGAPIRSEKLGTAPPSADVKEGPTKPLPAGAAPTVDKKVENK